MNSPRHDLHCRFYLNGACFEPDMSLLWDIGPEAMRMFPSKLWNDIARYQMCEPSSVPFPDVWKSHLIEVKPSYLGTGAQGSGSFHGTSVGYSGGLGYGDTAQQRAWKCAKAILEDIAESPWTLEQLNDVMHYFNEDAICDVVWTNLLFHRVDVQDLISAWPEKKPAKKIFNKALRRHQRELASPGTVFDLKEEDDELDTEPGSIPGGETGGSPPISDGYINMD